mgnify:CR=1 FL=1
MRGGRACARKARENGAFPETAGGSPQDGVSRIHGGPMHRRCSGLLLHLTCLPSPHGVGDLGPTARDFADGLARAGQAVWQMLPLTPTALSTHNDPYHSLSAFAGNPLLLSPEDLARDGLLRPQDIASPPDFPENAVDFARATAHKAALLELACSRFDPDDRDFRRFCAEEGPWLEDYALYAALRADFGGRPWAEWPEALRERDPAARDAARERLAGPVARIRTEQFLFARQWEALRRHCRDRGLLLFGDMPIYVDHDSADLWTRPELWKLGDDRRPLAVAGVPPDYFSATGQLWGSPVYDWPAHAAAGFDWWLARMERNLSRFDLLRIDHFRGLAAYWEVPAGEETAMNGAWVEAPGGELLAALARRRACLPLVAEDLGVITPDVRELMARFGLPGMKILLFAFGEDLPHSPYAPHNMARHAVAYTGTHDNLPTAGWWREEATAEDKVRLQAYLGHKVPDDCVARELVRLAWASPADLAVAPVQDLLGLGREARMNRPGVLAGNWGWRLTPAQAAALDWERLLDLTRLYGRA